MSKPNAHTKPLVSAAEALASDLDTFERLASGAIGRPLDSQKRLGRAGEMLQELCDAEEALQGRVAALVKVIAETRDRQQTLAGQVHAWALEVQTRAMVFQALRTRLAALGEEIAPLSTALEADEVDLEALSARLREVAELAGSLETDALEQGFKDVAMEGRARKEQLLAAVDKLHRATGTSLPEA